MLNTKGGNYYVIPSPKLYSGMKFTRVPESRVVPPGDRVFFNCKTNIGKGKPDQTGVRAIKVNQIKPDSAIKVNQIKPVSVVLVNKINWSQP